MALTQSACINHPGIEAVGRCKQCGRPFCNACKVQGPTGLFCSQPCKEKHETFVKRASQFDAPKGGTGIGVKLRRVFNIVLVVAIIAIILGVLGSFVDVPVLTPLVFKVRGIIGK